MYLTDPLLRSCVINCDLPREKLGINSKLGGRVAERLGRRTLNPELLLGSPGFDYMYTATLAMYPGN